jgi:adenosylcobinamide-GDP ribazoletransferase
MCGGNVNRRDIEIAVSFLTIVQTPAGHSYDLRDLGRSAWAFPLVGAGIGALIGLVNTAGAAVFSPAVAAVLTCASWAIVTGGLHLDGWSDCCDALPAPADPEKRMLIMKDPRLGAFGVMGLLFLLALKIAAIMALPDLLSLCAAPIVGRSLMVVITQGRSHGDTGMASEYLDAVGSPGALFALMFALIPVAFLGPRGILAGLVAYGAGMLFRRAAENKLGRLNGDVIGGICELTEVIFLLCVGIRL